MNFVEAFKLAHDHGYTLKVMLADEQCFYWLENHYFIGKPFECLEELLKFLQKMPPLLRGTV